MSERFVVDASVAAKWLFEEEDSALAASLREHPLMAPSLLWLECGSVIWNRVIRGVLAPAAVPEILACLNAAPVERVPMETRIERVLRIAVQLRHPVYDCAYLALAVMRDLRMVTADQRFGRIVADHPGLARHVVLLGRLTH